MSADRETRMCERLTKALAPLEMQLKDQSHLHAGHAGAKDGHGHFALKIVSDSFAGENTLARHRLVYAALGDMMQTDIHALSIRAFTPDENV